MTEFSATRQPAKSRRKGTFSAEHQPRKRGRPSNREKFGNEINHAHHEIAKNYVKMIRAQIALACGEAKEEVLNPKTGELHERQLPPDPRAFKELADRLEGKAVSRKELEVEVQQTQQLVLIVGEEAEQFRRAKQRHQPDVQALPAGEVPVLEGLFTTQSVQEPVVRNDQA